MTKLRLRENSGLWTFDMVIDGVIPRGIMVIVQVYNQAVLPDNNDTDKNGFGDLARSIHR